MRILMLSWEYPPHVVGGLGQHVADLAPALARMGVEVHLVTPLRRGGAERSDDGRLHVHRVPADTSGATDILGETWRTGGALAAYVQGLIASEGPFELIHNHDWLTAVAAREIKLRNRMPLVATVHATERGRGRGSLSGQQSHMINDIEWGLTFEAWRVIACSEYMREEIRAFFNTPDDKIDIIPNGVSQTLFSELEGVDLSEFKSRYALPQEKIVFYVGRLVYEKGIDTLIRSVPSVLAHVPEAKFIIAGRGPELDAMRDLVRSMHLEHKVLLPGFISMEDRDRLFKVADCAVFPSLYEPFGIVALEAMAARVPVVVSEVGGLKEVVKHGVTGITIYPGDAQSCAWGITHTLQHPEWAQMRVENALMDVRTIFNWDVIAGQTVDVYRRVIEERSHTDW
ncbi:MAG: glycosyltransferase family 4 protein [Anaerolineae bacterium]|jgi:glycogen(starch) synthase|nr:glycosyltransferase family 4 protein [Chloroflexota bacterium]